MLLSKYAFIYYQQEYCKFNRFIKNIHSSNNQINALTLSITKGDQEGPALDWNTFNSYLHRSKLREIPWLFLILDVKRAKNIFRDGKWLETLKNTSLVFRRTRGDVWYPAPAVLWLGGSASQGCPVTQESY